MVSSFACVITGVVGQRAVPACRSFPARRTRYSRSLVPPVRRDASGADAGGQPRAASGRSFQVQSMAGLRVWTIRFVLAMSNRLMDGVRTGRERERAAVESVVCPPGRKYVVREDRGGKRMQGSRKYVAGGILCLLVVLPASGAEEPGGPHQHTMVVSGALPPGVAATHVGQPPLVAGYIGYTYPALGTCPCRSDHCFHPWRYYCGGKNYRSAWRRKWLRAHFGHGSMLENYPCECICPTGAAPYFAVGVE